MGTPIRKDTMNETFEITTEVRRENSFGVIEKEKGCTIEFTVKVEGERGSFELHDIETGGNQWYAEGGLWFDGKTLIDYDGVFSLSPAIIDKLEEKGYDVSEMKG